MSTVEFTEGDFVRQIERVSKPLSGAKRESAAAIAATVARHHGLEVTDLLGPRRFPHLVRARLEWYRALHAQGWSYSAIGAVSGRDTATVMYAMKGKGSRPRDRQDARAA